MSTDLQLRPEIIGIRLPSIRITTSQPPSDTSDANSSTIQIENGTSTTGDDSVECRTPKSPENMIPQILNCPPAPRKQRRLVASCKRKLEFEFFETVAREEVESFFRSSLKLIDSQVVKKRRCHC